MRLEDLATQLDPAYVRHYLLLHGWAVFRADSLKEIWVAPMDETKVLLPRTRLDDYPERMAVAVAQLAASESRDEEDVVVDLSWPAYDKFSVRTRADRQGAAIPIHDALGLHNALRDLIVAAARASDQPRASFRGGWSTRVGNYFDAVRMIPSQPGSFVLRALLPLNAERPEELLFETTDTTSIRTVTRTLLRGIAAGRDAAERCQAGTDSSVFRDAVPNGVSADLLDALVRLGGAEDDPAAIELGVSWTYAAPEDPAPSLHIRPDLLPIMAEGAEALRGTPEEAQAELVGLVVRLHRDARSGPGEVTVQGYLDSGAGSSTRTMKMELDESTYGDAVAAHGTGSTVRVRCIVRHGGTRMKIGRVESFSVLSEH